MFRKLICTAASSATILISTAMPKAGVAQLVPYDDFNSRYINPAKWNGLQNYDPDIREALRQIVHDKNHGRLRLSQTAYSSTLDDSGGSGGVLGLAFPEPDAITEVSFAVTVDQAAALGCSNNDSVRAI